MIQSKLYSSTITRFHQGIDDSSNSDDTLEVSPEYKKEIVRKNITKIHLPMLKLSFYDVKDNTITVIEAHKATVIMKNDGWHQIDKYLIVKHLTYFKAHQLHIIEDKETVTDIKEIIEKDQDSRSFVAIKLKYIIQNSHSSK